MLIRHKLGSPGDETYLEELPPSNSAMGTSVGLFLTVNQCSKSTQSTVGGHSLSRWAWAV